MKILYAFHLHHKGQIRHISKRQLIRQRP